jgi:glutathione S-transferase
MHLYGTVTSPYVRHCRIALRHESIPFEFTHADFETSARDSPTKRVPYLRDGDLFLTDSTAILWHIRAHGGKQLFGHGRAREAERYFLADTALDTAINLFLLERDGVTDTSYLQRQKQRLVATFEALDATIGQWAGSWDDGFLRIGCLLDWVGYRNRYDISAHAGLARFHRTCEGWPVFAETAPPPQ